MYLLETIHPCYLTKKKSAFYGKEIPAKAASPANTRKPTVTPENPIQQARKGTETRGLCMDNTVCVALNPQGGTQRQRAAPYRQG